MGSDRIFRPVRPYRDTTNKFQSVISDKSVKIEEQKAAMKLYTVLFSLTCFFCSYAFAMAQEYDANFGEMFKKNTSSFSQAYWKLTKQPVEDLIAELQATIRMYQECKEERPTCEAKYKSRLECLHRFRAVACFGCLRACEQLTDTQPLGER
jgi:hypothetical protein